MNKTELIVARFFIALLSLKDCSKIDSVKEFTDRYNINRGNLYQLEKDKSSKIFEPGWLTILVEDYGVNPRWLLTGIGEIFGRS